MTITLAAVYAPIGFVSGLTGALFREFAFTLAGAVVVSGIIALTLSPMMASKLLKPHQSAGRFNRFLDRIFDGLRRRYQRRLNRTLNHRPVTLVVLAGVMAATAIMYLTSQQELAPEEDQGILFNIVKAPQTANLDYLEQVTGELNKVFDTVPEKEHVFLINGMNGDVRMAIAGILFKPWEDRARTQKEILQPCNPSWRALPAARRSHFRCRPCRAPQAAARRCSSWCRRRPTISSSRRCWPTCRRKPPRAACSSSRIRT